jgi:hypothetical protein
MISLFVYNVVTKLTLSPIAFPFLNAAKLQNCQHMFLDFMSACSVCEQY